MTATAPSILHVSLVVGGALRDAAGERLGRVDDLIVRLAEDYPPVTGAVASVAGRQVFVPAEQVGAIEPGRVTLRGERLDLQHFRRRPLEVLLKQDLLDRQLINVDGARLVRANEIELARLEGWYRVVGVDVGLRGLARRLVPRALAGRIGAGPFLDWARSSRSPATCPTVRLRVPHPKLARLHPAQLADLVEAAPHREGEEIIAALHRGSGARGGRVRGARGGHQLEFARGPQRRGDRRAARADGDRRRGRPLAQLDEDRREAILATLLPHVQQRRLRALLGYEPLDRGRPDEPRVRRRLHPGDPTEALDRVRRAAAPPTPRVGLRDQHPPPLPRRRLAPRPRPRRPGHASPTCRHSRSVTADADLDEVARAMTDYDLTIVPVLDDDERPIGIITVDDVLELVIPPPGRRFGIFGGI